MWYGEEKPLPSPADFRRNKETDFIAINFSVDAYRSYIHLDLLISVWVANISILFVEIFVSFHSSILCSTKCKKKNTREREEAEQEEERGWYTNPMDYYRTNQKSIQQFIDENEQQILDICIVFFAAVEINAPTFVHICSHCI